MRAGIEVGVYVCGFKISGMKTDEQDIETITIEPPTIVKLDVEIRQMETGRLTSCTMPPWRPRSHPGCESRKERRY